MTNDAVLIAAAILLSPTVLVDGWTEPSEDHIKLAVTNAERLRNEIAARQAEKDRQHAKGFADHWKNEAKGQP